jgi:hypothetical protein
MPASAGDFLFQVSILAGEEKAYIILDRPGANRDGEALMSVAKVAAPFSTGNRAIHNRFLNFRRRCPDCYSNLKRRSVMMSFTAAMSSQTTND